MDPLAEAADEHPEHPAVDVGGVAWTYDELDEHATRVARHLAGAGLAGRRVAAIVPSGAKAAWTLHGVPRAGCTLAPLNPGWTNRELVRVLDRLRPAAVIATADTEAQAAGAVQAANLVTLDQPTSNRGIHLEALPREDDPLEGPDAADPHTVLATSGTTGDPNLVAFDHQAHLAHARAAAERLSLGPDDRWLAALSPAHVGGLALWLRAATQASTVVPTPGFDAGHVAELVREGEVTHASLVPTMLHRLVEREVEPPSSFELALIGGAPCPPGLRERALDAGWPLALTYGLTEAASQVATATPAVTRRKPGTVGPPLDPVEVEIDDDELLVRGPTLATGYLDSEAPIDEDGWLHTGDLARIDEDGHLWITGRASERIVTGGVTVDPVEVEHTLAEHPGVEAACVVGLEDEEWGQIVHAAVVEREPGTLDAKTLRAFLEGKLSSAKHPRGWAFVDELERNANGKPDREAVRELLGG